VQDAPAEARRPRVGLVDVQRVEITEEAGREHEVRLGHGERRAERVADLDLVIVFAFDHDQIVADRLAAGKETPAAPWRENGRMGVTRALRASGVASPREARGPCSALRRAASMA